MNKCCLFFCVWLISFYSNAQITSLHESFSSCLTSIPNSWNAYSVIGSQTWNCTSGGQTDRGTIMNGFSGSANDNEDWLISPQLNLSAYSSPSLSFWCRTKYSGPFIQVMLSANYTGVGNPNMAAWTTLPAILPTANSDVWFLSDQIDLSAFKSQPFYIAFKYTSNSSFAATWKVDEVNVTDGSFLLPQKFLNVGDAFAGSQTIASTFQFTMSGSISNFTVKVPLPFELSKDGLSFANQLNYTNSISGIQQTAFVRLRPVVQDKIFRQPIEFALNGNTLGEKVFLIGTSLPPQKNLKMVTWNMKWFGDPVSCACDTNDARIYATKILKEIQADIYCLQEVVDTQKIKLLTTALGSDFKYIVSPFCSFATHPMDVSYASGQKLAYIFNTKRIQEIGSFGLLASTYPLDTSSNSAYYCFASGRFPFMMEAKLLLDGAVSDTIIFANIHAKAISDIASYNRRVCAAQKMTDSLNILYPSKKMVVIGDYNDYLEGSSVSGMGLSPYTYLLNNGFNGITLPSYFPNQSTYVGSTNNIIDNVVISSNLASHYPDSATFIFTEVEQFSPSYGITTSDHFPLVSYLKFDFPTSIKATQEPPKALDCSIINPSSNTLSLKLGSNETNSIDLRIINIQGKSLFYKTLKFDGTTISLSFPSLQKGLYFVELTNKHNRAVLKWLVL